MTAKGSRARIPWVALLLSLLSFGVGHIYCGRIVKGLAIFSGWSLFSLLLVTTALLPASSAALVGLVAIPAIGLLVLYFYAALDAWRLARRSGADYTLKDYNRGIVYALLITIAPLQSFGTLTAVREFTFQAFYIPSRSMSPSVLAGDRILVNKLRRDDFPSRGDLIVFRNPGRGASAFIKRVVAISGDTVELRDNALWINGAALPRQRVPAEQLEAIRTRIQGQVYEEENAGQRYRIMLSDPPIVRPQLANMGAAVVPPRSVFVLGDNRDRSRDSREFGTIHAGDIIGFPQYLFFPAASWSRFGTLRDQ